MIIKAKYDVGQRVLIHDGRIAGEISHIIIQEGGRIMYRVEYWEDNRQTYADLYERQIRSESEGIQYITVVTGSGVSN